MRPDNEAYLRTYYLMNVEAPKLIVLESTKMNPFFYFSQDGATIIKWGFQSMGNDLKKLNSSFVTLEGKTLA